MRFGETRARQLAALLVAGSMALALGGCFLFPNAHPVAAIAVSRDAGPVPLVVILNASDSYDPDGKIRTFSWDCGDGTTEEGSEIQHTYTQSGTYIVLLTVTDSRGAKAKDSVAIHVRSSNETPVAAFAIAPSPAQVGQMVWFDASASYDSDGFIISYVWDFGDGATGTGSLASHSYEEEGTYQVSLTIEDNDGAERTVIMPAVIGTEPSGGVTIPRHFEWEYHGTAQSCDLNVPEDLYAHYKTQPRTGVNARDYDAYVLDPLDDDYLEVVTQKILATTTDYHEQLENALFFVQECIRYVYDPYFYEYPRYPLELLVDGYGDCEDTAILYTSLVRTLGHGALMVVVDTDNNGVMDHMVAWVPVEPSFVNAHPDRSFWDYQGRTYAFAETAVDGMYIELGVDPWGLTEGQIDTIYDVSSVDHHPQVKRYVAP